MATAVVTERRVIYFLHVVRDGHVEIREVKDTGRDNYREKVERAFFCEVARAEKDSHLDRVALWREVEVADIPTRRDLVFSFERHNG